LIAKIQRQFNQIIVVIRLDSERGYSALYEMLRDLGIAIEARALYTEEQNGMIERAGAIIISRARAIRIEARLPKELSNECVMTAIYLLNRTPIRAIGWKTPFEAVQGLKPLVAHLNEIGAKAYTLNQSLKRADKLESRALVGQLVGYDSSNIYRIWMPTMSRVIRTRDVVFMNSENEVYPQQKELRRLATVLDIEDIPEVDDDIEQALRLLAQSLVQHNSYQIDDEAEDQLLNELDQSKGHQALPTPEPTPEPD
jgi:hypothetical protein